MSKTICYVQAGGIGSRLSPLLHQPGLRSVAVLGNHGRNLRPFNHNSYYASAKPVMPVLGTALCEPLIRSAVKAGVRDLRMTICNMPETVTHYFLGKNLGGNVQVKKFLFEHTRLDTSGGIVRDVVAGIKEGQISADDTILVLGGDIRAEVDLQDFLGEHLAKHSDISILLTEVSREEMYRLGAAMREGDKTERLGRITMTTRGEPRDYDVFGDMVLNEDKFAKIARFFEKIPHLDPRLVVTDGGLDIKGICGRYGVGALVPANLQNGSIYAIRAELIYSLAPLVFNLDREAESFAWHEAENVNISGESKFSDFGGDWFSTLSNSKDFPKVMPSSPVADLQSRIIEDLRSAPPQMFGYRLPKNNVWSDDGTLPAVLNSHFRILDDLVTRREEAHWPIAWDSRIDYGIPGLITMSRIDLGSVTINPPVFIAHGVILHGGAVVGPYAIINRGWQVKGRVSRSVLFPKKQVDKVIEEERGWSRFTVPYDFIVDGSLIGSGFELEYLAIDQEGRQVGLKNLSGKVVVSNGSQNVVSPIEI